jgi:hypothetical protein
MPKNYFLEMPKIISQKCQKVFPLSAKKYFLKVPKLISLKCSLGCKKGAL